MGTLVAVGGEHGVILKPAAAATSPDGAIRRAIAGPRAGQRLSACTGRAARRRRGRAGSAGHAAAEVLAPGGNRPMALRCT